MTLAQAPFLVRHVIPHEEICRKVGMLMDALVNGDEDPADIDLTDLAVRFLVRDLTYQALNVSLALGSPKWTPAPNGDVEVIYPCQKESDPITFKLMFG
jgi:hypothetical protein